MASDLETDDRDKHASFAFDADVTGFAHAHPKTNLPTVKFSFLDSTLQTFLDSTIQGAFESLPSPGMRKAFFINAHCCTVLHREGI